MVRLTGRRRCELIIGMLNIIENLRMSLSQNSNHVVYMYIYRYSTKAVWRYVCILAYIEYLYEHGTSVLL